MAFLDNIDRKLTMLGQGAIQKTKEVSATAKIADMIRTLEIQKKEYFIELGSLFYLQHQEIADEKESIYIEKINAINIQIKEAQEQMSKLKGVIYCPECNAEVPINSAFCSVCGAKIEAKQHIPETVRGNVCKQCGAFLEDNQIFCTNCGTKIEQAIEEDYGKLIEKENIIENDIRLKCPNCQGEIVAEQVFCENCGAVLK